MISRKATKKTKNIPMKTTKTINNTSKKKASKKNDYRYFDEYKDFFTKRWTPVSERFLERLCDDLIDWASDDSKKALTAEKFWQIKGIPFCRAKEWRDRFPPLKEAYENAKKMIGIRREEGSLLKKFDNSTFFRTALNYSQDFKETSEWDSNLKQKADEKTQAATIQWVLEKFPNSNLVPEKKKEEDG